MRVVHRFSGIRTCAREIAEALNIIALRALWGYKRYSIETNLEIPYNIISVAVQPDIKKWNGKI